jgi:hypothetical protein
VFVRVASDPTCTARSMLADVAPGALSGDQHRPSPRPGRGVEAKGGHAPDVGIDGGRPLVIDLDGTLVTAHSYKKQACPTFNR